jgi:hypothetical protein
MPKLSVYDPPMCCSTGVCGPDGDDQLAQFAAALDWARKSGADVERYDLGHQPGAFASNPFIKGLLERDGMTCLPLVLIDGEVLSKGAYPTRDAIAARLGLNAGADANVAKTASACCGAAPASTTAQAASACCGSAATAKAAS